MPDFGTRSLVLRMATAAAPSTFVDYTAQVSVATIDAAESDSDFVSFADAAAGGATDWTLKLTFKQANDTSTLWRKMWTETGTDCPFEFWPLGRPTGGVATTSQPKFTGTATITVPDGTVVGGEADKSSTAKFTNEVEWKCIAKPTLGES